NRKGGLLGAGGLVLSKPALASKRRKPRTGATATTRPWAFGSGTPQRRGAGTASTRASNTSVASSLARSGLHSAFLGLQQNSLPAATVSLNVLAGSGTGTRDATTDACTRSLSALRTQ